MSTHERFYGQAVEEVAKGIKRDGMWAKALVLAEGDINKAQIIYVDLLARHFSEVASDTERLQRNSRIFSVARKVFTVAAKFAVWILLAGGLTVWLGQMVGSIEREYAKEMVKKAIPEDEEIALYYKAILALEQDVQYENIPEYVLDAVNHGTYYALLKHSDPYGVADHSVPARMSATEIVQNEMAAREQYNATITKPPGWPLGSVEFFPKKWALIVFIFFTGVGIITLAVVKFPFRKASPIGGVSPNNSLQARRP